MSFSSRSLRRDTDGGHDTGEVFGGRASSVVSEANDLDSSDQVFINCDRDSFVPRTSRDPSHMLYKLHLWNAAKNTCWWWNFIGNCTELLWFDNLYSGAVINSWQWLTAHNVPVATERCNFVKLEGKGWRLNDVCKYNSVLLLRWQQMMKFCLIIWIISVEYGIIVNPVFSSFLFSCECECPLLILCFRLHHCY